MKHTVEKILRAESQGTIQLVPPLPPSVLERVLRELGAPPFLADLYECSNGVIGEGFFLFPLFDERSPKKTWDSLERQNDPTTTRFDFFRDDVELLDRFIVIADLGGENCLACERETGKLWFLEGENLFESSLSFEEVLIGLLRGEED